MGCDNLEEKIFDSDFFNRLNTLKIGSKIKLNQGMGGGRKSNAKGNSVEFSDFREYILGDDIRRIDWNAYGRMDKLFVKLFMEEKEGLFNIFIDASKSMDFGKDGKSKYALKIAGALSYIILNNLDRVYISVLKDLNITTTKGMTGRQSFQKILKELENIKFEGSTNLLDAVKKRGLSKKGVSIIISDFFDNNQIEDLIKYLLYKNQEIVLVQVLAREETDPLLEGTVKLIDSENMNEMKVTLTSSVFKSYMKTLNDFTKQLNQLSKKYGLTYIKTISDEPLEKLIFEGMNKTSLILRQ